MGIRLDALEHKILTLKTEGYNSKEISEILKNFKEELQLTKTLSEHQVKRKCEAIRVKCRAVTTSQAICNAARAGTLKISCRASVVLSERRQEVLSLLADGRTYEEISLILYISLNSVKTHVSKAIADLNAKNAENAVYISLQCGVIPLKEDKTQLTSTEKLILMWLIKATSKEQIGAKLGLSPKTITDNVRYIPRIYKKLGASNLESATVQAVKKKVIPSIASKRHPLEKRQQGILQGIAAGKSQVAIAVTLKMSNTQFREAWKELLALFEVDNGAQLMWKAASCGLV